MMITLGVILDNAFYTYEQGEIFQDSAVRFDGVLQNNCLLKSEYLVYSPIECTGVSPSRLPNKNVLKRKQF